MKKLLSVLLMLAMPSFAQSLYEEGLHYEVINKTATKTKQLEEYFSYGCPGCYRMEPVIKELKKSLPAEIKFKKIHVEGLGYTSRELQNTITKAMYAAKSLKVF